MSQFWGFEVLEEFVIQMKLVGTLQMQFVFVAVQEYRNGGIIQQTVYFSFV